MAGAFLPQKEPGTLFCLKRSFAVKSSLPKRKPAVPKKADRAKSQDGALPESTSEAEILAPEAFLQEAKEEPKRKLITDHSQTATVLRDEKRLTFREIAEWLNQRGFKTDHSAVYRAYLSAIPPEMRDPRESDDDELAE